MLTEEQKRIGRRNFLKALVTLPAVGAFGYAVESKDVHDRPLRVGIIGSGSEGRVLMEQAPTKYIEFKAIADIRPDSRDEALEVIKERKAPKPEIYPDDYHKMLARDDLEAVFIATPLWMHAQMAVDALNAGKHVLCEKTMAWDVEGCKKMARAARDNRRILQIGHQRRANPLYASAKKMIEEGLIGEIYYARTLWHRNGDWRRDVPDLAELQKKEPQFDPTRYGYGSLEELVNWRLYEKYSQGLMAELGSHQLDVVDWFSDTKAKRIYGAGGLYYWTKDGRNVADHVFVTVEYGPNKLSPKGTTATFTSLTTNAFDDYYEQFMGTKGTIILAHESEAMLFKEGEDDKATEVAMTQGAGGPVMEATASRLADIGGGQAQAPGTVKEFDRMAAYRLEIEGFYRAIKFGLEPPCTADQALASAVVVCKGNESIAKKQAIELGEDVYAI